MSPVQSRLEPPLIKNPVADRFFCIVNGGIGRHSGGGGKDSGGARRIKVTRIQAPKPFSSADCGGRSSPVFNPGILSICVVWRTLSAAGAGLGEARMRLRPISCFLRSLDPINPMRSDWQSQCDPAVTQCEIYALKAADLISDLETNPTAIQEELQ